MAASIIDNNYMNGFYEQFFCEQNNDYSVIIEDDGRVCYAYLMENNNIIGDVWLYNTIETPTSVDWSLKEDMPFLNPLIYIDPNKTIKPINNSADVSIYWEMTGDELKESNVYVRNKLVAKLKMGHKPGWSTLVLKDGPLAKSLK